MNIHTIIKQFRNRMCLRKTKKTTSVSHFAFAIFDSKKSNKDSNRISNKKNKKLFFRKKSIEAFECICDRKH